MRSTIPLLYLSCSLLLIIPAYCDEPNLETNTVAQPEPSQPDTSTRSSVSKTDSIPPSLKKNKGSPKLRLDSKADAQPQYEGKLCNVTAAVPNDVKRLDCSNQSLTSIPDFSKFSNLNELKLNSNSIDKLEVDKLPPSLEKLDLSGNKIRRFVPNKSAKTPLLKLSELSLRSNNISSMANFSSLRFDSLRSLDLSYNPLVDLSKTLFASGTKLNNLNIAMTGLRNIHELAFSNLTELRTLNMSHLKLTTYDLGYRFLANNQQLEKIDLTNNSLLEVPHMLRSVSNLKTLILDHNLMTSLRPSDFINKTNLVSLSVSYCDKLISIDESAFADLTSLKELILTDNTALKHVSKNCFKSNVDHYLDIIDLSDNGLATLSNPLEFTSLHFKNFELRGNPWNCSCSLRWLLAPAFSASPLHCKFPVEFKDMEISSFFHSTDCEAEENPYHTVILTLFFLFLLGLTIAVFVQKTDMCRRFFGRDQYGTIYYTKANFQPDNSNKTEMT